MKLQGIPDSGLRRIAQTAFDGYWFSPLAGDNLKTFVRENMGVVGVIYGCHEASAKWAVLLDSAGFDVEVHHGFYDLYGDDSEPEGHTWLDVNGSIFDPTASQFEAYPEMDEDGYVVTDVEEVKDIERWWSPAMVEE